MLRRETQVQEVPEFTEKSKKTLRVLSEKDPIQYFWEQFHVDYTSCNFEVGELLLVGWPSFGEDEVTAVPMNSRDKQIDNWTHKRWGKPTYPDLNNWFLVTNDSDLSGFDKWLTKDKHGIPYPSSLLPRNKTNADKHVFYSLRKTQNEWICVSLD